MPSLDTVLERLKGHLSQLLWLPNPQSGVPGRRLQAFMRSVESS